MSAGLNSLASIKYPSPGELLAAAIVLPLVGLLIISLRYFVRFSRKSSFGIDDWLLIPAWLAITGLGACIITGVKKKALGYPAPPPDSTSMEALLSNLDPVTSLSERLDFSISILTILACCFIKLSIIFLYRRIFVISGYWTTFNVVTWILVAIVIGWSLAFIFLFIFNCGAHVAAQWGSREDLLLFCGAGLKHQEALYVSEFVTNVLLVLAPIPSIFRLHVKVSVKLQILGILLLAFSAFAASIVRLILTLYVVRTVTFGENFDIDQTNSTVFYWSMIEAGIALIACCLSILKPILTDRAPGSAVASIRHLLSVRSNTSQASTDIPGTWESIGTNTEIDAGKPSQGSWKEPYIEMQPRGS